MGLWPHFLNCMNPTKSLLSALFASVLVCATPSLRAQDVIVSDLNYDTAYTLRTPDVHAEFVAKPEVTNLAPLRQLDTCAYTIVNVHVRETGESSVMTQSTHYRTMMRVMPGDPKTLQFKPAEIFERPVAAPYWYSVIYNPPGASLDKPNAMPRVIRVCPVPIPAEAWEKNKDRQSVLWAEAKISKTGGLMEYHFLPESEWAGPLKDHIEKFLDAWRFSPARRDGAPVVGTVRFPIRIAAGAQDSAIRMPAADKGGGSSADEPLTQDIVITEPQLPVRRIFADTPPAFIHPPAARNGGVLDGVETYAYAIVSQSVEETGAVNIRSCTVDGTDEALKKVLPENYTSLVFQPGLREGKAVGTLAWYSVIYNPPGAAPQKTDAAPRLIAVYPVEVYGEEARQFKGKDRIIWVSATVNKKGAIEKFTPEPKYDYAQNIKPLLTERFKGWRFEPARANGKAVVATVRLPVCMRIIPNGTAPKATNPLPKTGAAANARKDGPNTYLPAEDAGVVELPTYTVVGNRVLPAPESWSYASIPGMEVLSNASPRVTRKFVADFAEFQNAMNVVWPALTNAKPRMPTLFVLCGKSGSYGDIKPSTRKNASVIDQRASAFLEDSERSAIIIDYHALDALSNRVGPHTVQEHFMDPFRQTYKQYTRYLIRRAAGETPFPPWLEEGVARIVETIDFQRKYIEFAKIDDEFFRYVSTHALMPMEKMLFTKSSRGFFWGAQSYIFVHMCLFGEGKKYQKAFFKYLDRYQSKEVDEADFIECFGMNYNKMLIVMRGYTQFCHHETTIIKSMKKGEAVVPPATPVPVRAATQSEIGRIRGEVLRLGNRPIESREALIVPYLRGDRDSALLASLGLLESLEKRDDRALKFLEAAAKAGAERPRAYHALAKLRLQKVSGKDESADTLDAEKTAYVIAPLATARNQPPPMADVYLLYGDILMRGSTPPNDGQLAALVEGVRNFPRDPNVIYKAAQLFAKFGHAPVANELIEMALRLDLKTTMRGKFEMLAETLAQPAT